MNDNPVRGEGSPIVAFGSLGEAIGKVELPPDQQDAITQILFHLDQVYSISRTIAVKELINDLIGKIGDPETTKLLPAVLDIIEKMSSG